MEELEVEQDRPRMQALLDSAAAGRAAFLAGDPESPLVWHMAEVARGVAASGLVRKEKKGQKDAAGSRGAKSEVGALTTRSRV